MKTIQSLFLIICIAAGHQICLADHKDVQVEHYTDQYGREHTTYEGGSPEDRAVAIILGNRQEESPVGLYKYVFSGSESDTIAFSTEQAKISFRVEITGNDAEQTRLTVLLLNENDVIAGHISRAIGTVSTYDTLDIKEGNYKIRVSQKGPGNWEIWAVAPGSASFSSSQTIKSSPLF